MSKKEDYNYFNEFIKVTGYIVESSNTLKDIMENFNYEKLNTDIHEVHRLENESDKIVHKMRGYLIKDFLPPIDREDIAEIINKLDYGFGNFFMYLNFYELFSENHDDKDNQNICVLEVFSILISELNFFIIGTSLIFICYKKKYSLDYILCFLIPLFLIFKVRLILLKFSNSCFSLYKTIFNN